MRSEREQMGEEREDPSDSSKQLFQKDNGADMRRKWEERGCQNPIFIELWLENGITVDVMSSIAKITEMKVSHQQCSETVPFKL